MSEEELEQSLESENLTLNEEDKQFVDNLIDKLLVICDQMSGHPLTPYQLPFARRIFESLIVGDGATITALFARQSGKTETVANCVATAMVMLPRLAKIFPFWLGKYKEGLWVGAFAPVDEQADNLFSRISERLQGENPTRFLMDPDIDERVSGRGRTLFLRCGSLVRKTTCHPKATIEGRTYHLILIDEAQYADSRVINQKVAPMGASTNSTMIMTGTPTYEKGVFYETIQQNKRETAARSRNRNHFEIDWRTVAKYNKEYKKYIELKEIRRLGEDSDEFKLSYRIIWLLEKGMFTTSERLDELGDDSMQSLVHAYHRTPVVAGIDCGRKQDKTIVTVVYVDWDNPDPFGLYHHHVLSWLDLEGMDWEEQYFRIVEFLSNYNIFKLGIDIGGLGDTVAQRLKILMPHIDIVELGSANSDQSVRWKHLKQLMDHRQISWPNGAKVRRLKVWKRFRQEMEDLEIRFKGPYVLAEAPKATNAHDDYPDSLSMACILSTLEEGASEEVQTYDNVFYRRERLR